MASTEGTDKADHENLVDDLTNGKKLNNKKYRDRVEKGVCGSCGKPNDDPEYKICPKCRKVSRDANNERQAEGLCRCCGKPRDGKAVTCSECTAKRYAYCTRRRHLLRKAVVEGYGGECNCCGEVCFDVLQVDHVNNDGYKDKGTKLRGGEHLYKKIICDGFPDSYQVLCANCNWGKKMNDGVWPDHIIREPSGYDPTEGADYAI